MSRKNPYAIVHRKHVTEKSVVLGNLESAESNPSVARCKSPKSVFIVDPNASKGEIARACEEIYRERGVKVVKVNTLTVKRKKRRMRGRVGYKPGYKKAVVTFEAGDRIEEV